MKNFRVKLIDGHFAKETENVKGYLGDATLKVPMPMVYSRGAAIKKARMYHGKIEEIKNNVMIEDLKIAKVEESKLTAEIRLELNVRTPEFKDTEKTLNEAIYNPNVFFNILSENRKRLSEQTIEQLEILIENMYSYDYVLIAKI